MASISSNGSKGHHKFTLNVTENRTSTSENKSYISFSFVLSPITSGYDWNYSSTVPVRYTVTINGTNYTGNIMSYNGSSTVTVRSGSNIPIAHNSDGTKTISYSFSVTSISASYLPGSASASGSMTLTNIPREAKFVSAPNFSDVDNPTITFSNPAGNSATVFKTCISLTGATDDIAYRDIVPKTSTSYKFTLSDAERNVLKNATTGSSSRTVYFYLWTVIGGVERRVSKPVTFSVVNANPIVSGTVIDVNPVTSQLTSGSNTSNKLIKYYSNAKATIIATPQKGASINTSLYRISNGGSTYNGANHTFNNVESNVFTFYAEDNRRNGTTYTLSPVPTMVNYVKLSCDISNNKPDVTGNMTVSCSGNYFNGSFGTVSNTLTVQYRYKTLNGSYGNWTDMTYTLSGNTYDASATLTGLNYQTIYTFQTRAIDKLTTIPSKESTVTSKPVFHWGKNDVTFEVPVTINGDLEIDGLSGIVKATGGTLGAATAGTDYVSPNGNQNFNGWVTTTNGDTGFQHVHSTSGKSIKFGVGSNGTSRGIYDDSLGRWIIYTNGTNTYIGNSSGSYAIGVNNVLWSGGMFMNQNQTITLSQAVSAQQTGIVLVFSEYNTSTQTYANATICSHFVSKHTVSVMGGCGHYFNQFTNWSGAMCKYLYISNTTIRGHDVNDNGGTYAGITYQNTMYVLRYVIGV